MLLVGYLRILPPTTGCYPAFPIARGDVPYVDGVEWQLTAMLADQAANHGAVFVDSYADSLGHDACQESGVKWVEGPLPPALPPRPPQPHRHAGGRRFRARRAQDRARVATLGRPADHSASVTHWAQPDALFGALLSPSST